MQEIRNEYNLRASKDSGRAKPTSSGGVTIVKVGGSKAELAGSKAQQQQPHIYQQQPAPRSGSRSRLVEATGGGRLTAAAPTTPTASSTALSTSASRLSAAPGAQQQPNRSMTKLNFAQPGQQGSGFDSRMGKLLPG